MDFQSNKINQPFNPNPLYFQGLSNNIQSRVGIEVKNVVETKTPQIEFNIKQKPIQLTVEFGFPLTAEKNIEVESIQKQVEDTIETNIITNQNLDSSDNLVKDDEIGQIHIEPIHLAANPNPYWHNFNSDDELEGLVLDSEGQEMSDITINGDAMFDIDQHFLQKDKPEIVLNEVPEVLNEITEISPVVSEIDFIASEESPIEIDNASLVVINNQLSENDILSVVNDGDLITNDISSVVVVDDNQAEEAFFSFSFTPEISAIPEVELVEDDIILNEVESIANAIESIEVTPIVSEVISEVSNDMSDLTIEIPSYTENNQAIEYSFSDAELDNLHEQMSQQLETIQPEQKVAINKKSEAPAITFVEFSTNEIAIETEREYIDSELDLLHDQLSIKIEASKPRVAEPVVNIKNSSETKVNEESVTSNFETIIEAKTSIMEMIPWSSVFGIVASLMAVASAWFIWNSIQKPIAIDEFIDSKIAPMVSHVNTPVSAAPLDKTLSLAPADFIANEILEEVENPTITENNFKFVNLSDQSKISAVVLESNGLTTLELEDGFFEDLGI
jgi:hypothetical protein